MPPLLSKFWLETLIIIIGILFEIKLTSLGSVGDIFSTDEYKKTQGIYHTSILCSKLNRNIFRGSDLNHQ